LIPGCGESDQDKWANAPSTQGQLNLDAVKQAFQKNPRYDDFEQRVNEIFEGDRLVIFQSERVSGGFSYTAKEDLDADKKISPADDTLFTLLVANGTATLKGAGVNSYYSQSWPYAPAKDVNQKTKNQTTAAHHRRHGTYFYHWYGYLGYRWLGGYYTPAPRYNAMSRHRNAYRATPAFQSQVVANTAFTSRMASRYGAGFRKSPTTARKTYISKNRGLASTRTSSSTARSGAGAKSRSTSRSSSSRSSASRSRGGFGGFRGSSGFGV
jgi:hypothetical protein